MNGLWLVAMHVVVIAIASACVMLVEAMLRAARSTGEPASPPAWSWRRPLNRLLPTWPHRLHPAPGDRLPVAGSHAQRRAAPLTTSLRQPAEMPVMPGRTSPWQRLAEVAARPEFRQLHYPQPLPRDG